MKSPLGAVGTLVVISAMALSAQSVRPSPKAKSWILPRTPDGHPDLQGTWTNATLTPMERPPEFAGKLTLTAEPALGFSIFGSLRISGKFYASRMRVPTPRRPQCGSMRSRK